MTRRRPNNASLPHSLYVYRLEFLYDRRCCCSYYDFGVYTLLHDHYCVWKLYFFLAPLSTTLGRIHEMRLINQYTLGSKTSLVPSSTAFTHSRATYSAFNAPFRLSLTSPKSTAELRKSPSTVAGQTMEKLMRGCSIERDRYRIKEAAFVDP